MKDKKAKSFVTIMIVLAVCALIFRIVIERLIKINIVQNESHASVTLKLVAQALENYAKDNKGAYPSSLSVLTETKPPYVEKNYVSSSPLRGYNYNCSRLDVSGYSCSAIPTSCNLTGNTIYSITTGSLLVTEKCEKKE